MLKGHFPSRLRLFAPFVWHVFSRSLNQVKANEPLCNLRDFIIIKHLPRLSQLIHISGCAFLVGSSMSRFFLGQPSISGDQIQW